MTKTVSSFYAWQARLVRCPLRSVLAVAGLLLIAGCSGPEAGIDGSALESAAAGDLCPRIEAVLRHSADRRLLDASQQGAWQVVHGVLAFGPAFPLAHDGAVSPAVEFLLGGGRIAGWEIRVGDVGPLAVVDEGSVTGQGHPDQWLGYLSQCGVATGESGLVGGLPLDTPIRAGGRDFTLADLLAQAKRDIRPGQECSWTLMALAAYDPPDASWEASDGRRWTTEAVARMEAQSEIVGAACGGTHRLYGLAAAVAAYRAVHPAPPPPESGWALAESVLAEYIDRARQFQQPDGSFSVHYFERPGRSPDVFSTLGATGHVFEILPLVLDDESLAAPWVSRAAERLVTLLERTTDLDLECGGLYHAAHGLALYRRRLCDRSSAAADPLSSGGDH